MKRKKSEFPFGVDDEGNYSIIRSIREQLEMTQGVEIARRYFAMNAFDGILPMIGIIMGALISTGVLPISEVFTTTLLAAIGTSVALFVSGVTSSYLTEQAERIRDFQELEKSMLADLSETAYARATKTTTRVVSLINGLSPALAVFATISPMILSHLGMVGRFESLILSVISGILLLFLIGMFLGKVSKSNAASYGLKTVAAGIIVVIIMWVLSFITEAT